MYALKFDVTKRSATFKPVCVAVRSRESYPVAGVTVMDCERDILPVNARVPVVAANKEPLANIKTSTSSHKY